MKSEMSVLYVIEKATGISLKKIMSKDGTKYVSEARQLLLFFMWYGGVPIDFITDFTGYDRNAVNYAVKRIEGFISINDKRILDLINKINELKNVMSY